MKDLTINELGGINTTKPKRKQVKNACVNCKASCKRCEDARPCFRCIERGLESSCIDSKRKPREKGIKRGPYKKRKTTYLSSNITGSETNYNRSIDDENIRLPSFSDLMASISPTFNQFSYNPYVYNESSNATLTNFIGSNQTPFKGEDNLISTDLDYKHYNNQKFYETTHQSSDDKKNNTYLFDALPFCNSFNSLGRDQYENLKFPLFL